MIIGVDLDGVCADVVLAYRFFYARQRGLAPQTLGAVTDYEFSSWGLNRPLTSQPEFAEAMEDGMAALMSPIPRAAETIGALASDGYRVRIITGRLIAPGMTRTLVDTVSWLDRHGFFYEDLCFVRDKRDVWADVYIEDDPEIVALLAKSGRKVIVFDQQYNRGLDPQVSRVLEWPDVRALLAGPQDGNSAH